MTRSPVAVYDQPWLQYREDHFGSEDQVLEQRSGAGEEFSLRRHLITAASDPRGVGMREYVEILAECCEFSAKPMENAGHLPFRILMGWLYALRCPKSGYRISFLWSLRGHVDGLRGE